MGQSSTDVDWIAEVVQEELEQTEVFREVTKDVIDANDKLDALAEAIMSAALAGDATQRQWRAADGVMKATVSEVRQAVVKEGQARATAIDSLKSETDKTSASLTELRQTTASADKAISEQVTGLTARVKNGEAAINVRGETIFEKNGTGSAVWSVGTGVKVNGVYHGAGLSVGAEVAPDGTVKTRILLSADQFAVMNPADSSYALPFFIQGGQVFMRSTCIQDGSITNLMIGDYIQSKNYVSGIQGWRLNKNGVFENIASDGSGATKQDGVTISVRDKTRLRVQIGKLTGHF